MTAEQIKNLREIDNGFNGEFVFDPAHTEDRGIGLHADCADTDDRLMFVPVGCDVRDEEACCIFDTLEPHVAEPIATLLNAVPELLNEVERLRTAANACLVELRKSYLEMSDIPDIIEALQVALDMM